MSLLPPDWSELWGDVVTHHPMVRWPVANETDLEQLSDEWQRLGNDYSSGDHFYSHAELLHAWTGGAGQEYQRQVDEAHKNSHETGVMALDMSDLVRAFRFSVGRCKHEIWNLMEKHEDGYLDLTWSLFAWFHPTEAGREAEKYRAKVAGEVASVLRKHLANYKDSVEQLNVRIAGRG